MDSKYYTPNETEYHIGFEYQSLTDERFPDDDKSWSNEIIDSIKDLRDVCHYLIVDDFIEHRVKYLDFDDIESLGWEQQFEGEYSFSKIGYRLFYDYEGKEMTILHYHSGDYLFVGKIKNKSELKKLLTQLNII